MLVGYPAQSIRRTHTMGCEPSGRYKVFGELLSSDLRSPRLTALSECPLRSDGRLLWVATSKVGERLLL